MTDFAPEPPQSVWADPSRVDLLRRLWAEGFSCSQIARQIGGVTRNAVIGKVTRLGLDKRAPRKAPVVRLRPAERAPSPFNRFGEVRRRSAPITVADPPPPPTCEPVSFADLELRHCRFPIGDPREPGFGFCGAERPDVTKSYCKWHEQLAYIPSAKQAAAERAIERAAAFGGRG